MNMFAVQKFKSVIGVFAFILIITLSPSAEAGKSTGGLFNLTGTLCKSFGGTWKAGKFGTCTISATSTPNKAFKIAAGDSLIINGAFTNNTTIANFGSISVGYGGIFTNADHHTMNYGSISVSDGGTFSGCVDNYPPGTSSSNVILC